MKKNILTIIIMAIVLINTVLTAVLIFTIVPTANKTTKLVNKVASVVNLELEDPDKAGAVVAVEDIVTHKIPDKLTIKLKSDVDEPHYAAFYVSLSMNSKNKDYGELSEKITDNENAISEIVNDEFAKYTMDEINTKKDEIKTNILVKIKEYFKSDFIINVTFGNIILS